MSEKVLKLFDKGGHVCLFVTGLVEGEGIVSFTMSSHHFRACVRR